MRTVSWIIVAIAAGISICGPLIDPDLWWHIVVGRWILAHHTVPVVDHWTLFGQGTPWRAYSWLPEILFAAFDSRFGIPGLLILQTILAALLSLALSLVFSRLARDYLIGLLLGVFVTSACFNHFTLRPQSFVWIYIASLVACADTIAKKGVSIRSLFLIFFIMVLWANTHITAVLGLLILVGWLGSTQLRGSGTGVRVPLVALGAGLLGTFVTPYRGGEWVTFAATASHPFAFQGINEFEAATIVEYPTAFLLILVVLVLAFLHRSPRSIEIPKIVLAALFTLGGLAVVKFLPVASIIVAAVLATLWERTQDRPDISDALGEGIRRLKGVLLRVPPIIVACVALISIAPVLKRNSAQPLAPGFVPVKSLDFILANNLPRPILNAFSEGGYVMYRMSDPFGEVSDKVSIDGRTNLISEALWNSYAVAFDGREGWRGFVEKVKPATVLWRSESPLYTLLLESKEWCHLFREGSGTRTFSVLLSRAEFEKRGLPSSNCSAVPGR